jgi:enoyl-CoA hydratase/carnithine racemase
MKYETLSYETSGDIATVRLSQPFSDMRMVRELTAVCDHLEDENPCKAVVFRGCSEYFSRGINFAEFKPDSPMDIHGFNKWEKMCSRIERLPKVTVAAVEGDVIGGGFQLALVTDVRVAHPSARFQLPEVKLGFLPGMAVFRLAKYIGIGAAKRLILQSEVLDADAAHDLRLVDVVSEDIDNAITGVIARFRPIRPVTVQLARRLLNESFHDSFEDAIGHFLAAQHRAISQNVFMETVKKQSDD